MITVFLYSFTKVIRWRFNIIIWLRCDWLLERARWRYLPLSRLPAVSRKKIMLFVHIINPLLTNLARSIRLDIVLVLFFRVFTDLGSISAYKHAKKNLLDLSLGQYPISKTVKLIGRCIYVGPHSC